MNLGVYNSPKATCPVNLPLSPNSPWNFKENIMNHGNRHVLLLQHIISRPKYEITGNAFSQFRTQSITCWKQTIPEWRAFVEPWLWNSPYNFQLDCNLFAYQFHFCLYTTKESIVKVVQFFVAVGFMVESNEWWSNGEVEEKKYEWCWIW